MATLAAVLNSSPPPPVRSAPCFLELEQLVESALAKYPAERPATAGGFAAFGPLPGLSLARMRTVVEYLERLGIELHGQAPLPPKMSRSSSAKRELKSSAGVLAESGNLLLCTH